VTLVVVAAWILLVGAGLACAVPSNDRRAAVSIASQALATILVEVAVLPVLFYGSKLERTFVRPYPINEVLLRVDAVSAFFLAFSLPMTLLGSIYAVGYLEPYFKKARHAGLHFALLNLTSLAFVLVYTLQNGLVFFFGWELAALAAWLLVIWDYTNQKIRFAGFNYLVSTHFSFLFLLAAFMILHSRTNAWDFDAFGAFLKKPSPARNVTFILLVASFGLKSAFFPFHTWLPRAHSAAPAHVSALMSGVIHKAGLYGMVRFILLIGTPDEWMGWFLIVFSAISAVGGVLYTAAQRDLKRLLGYSSTENVGIAGIGFGVGCLGLSWGMPSLVALGFAGGILHVLNHAFFKCLLFYGAGAIYRMTHTIDLERLGGLAKKMPLTAILFLVGAVAISALPPLNGFVSEFCIYSGLLGAPVAGVARGALIATAAVLAFVGGVSALSMTRAFGLGFLGSPRDPGAESHGEAPRSMLATMIVHAAGSIALGVVPALGLALVTEPTRLVVAACGGAAEVDAALAARGELLAPIARVGLIFLGVLGALALLRRALVRASRRHVTWGCGYTEVSPRMQYTGSSFSAQFRDIFEAFLPLLAHEKLPQGPFPKHGEVKTHCVDAVERRMFKVMGEGEDSVRKIVERASGDARLSFALGLVVLVTMIGVIAVGRSLP
jgi:hydrogenase-4 component B